MNIALRRVGNDRAGTPQIRTTKVVTPVRREIAGLVAVGLRLIDQHGSVVIYFTAVSHGEGTSSIARELAITAARSPWCKVALIDASVGTGGSGTQNSRIGLLEVKAEGEDLPFSRSWFGDVSLMEGALIGAGNPLPSVEAVRTLFDRLRTEFKLIIVDGPPISSARQAAAFSAAANCVVLVVEADRTRARDIEHARATLEQLGARVLGVVLNKRRSWIPGRLSRLIWGAAP
jgi:Mrp family chromosome partitioning ATPase